jgi:hypothetical protein
MAMTTPAISTGLIDPEEDATDVLEDDEDDVPAGVVLDAAWLVVLEFVNVELPDWLPTVVVAEVEEPVGCKLASSVWFTQSPS